MEVFREIAGYEGRYQIGSRGTLNAKNKNLWKSKTECTDEAINSVRDYMVQELLGGLDCEKAISSGYEWTLKDGRVVELRVTIKQPAE